MWFALYTISVQSFTPSHLGSTWSNVAIGPKVSGQATAVDKSGRVLAFGGLTDGAGSPCTSDVWAYKSSTWSKLDATGGPGPRMYAASAILDNALYCFGGWDPEAPGTGGTFKDEAWKLDLATNDWSMLEPLPCGAELGACRHTVADGSRCSAKNPPKVRRRLRARLRAKDRHRNLSDALSSLHGLDGRPAGRLACHGSCRCGC